LKDAALTKKATNQSRPFPSALGLMCRWEPGLKVDGREKFVIGKSKKGNLVSLPTIQCFRKSRWKTKWEPHGEKGGHEVACGKTQRIIDKVGLFFERKEEKRGREKTQQLHRRKQSAKTMGKEKRNSSFLRGVCKRMNFRGGEVICVSNQESAGRNQAKAPLPQGEKKKQKGQVIETWGKSGDGYGNHFDNYRKAWVSSGECRGKEKKVIGYGPL